MINWIKKVPAKTMEMMSTDEESKSHGLTEDHTEEFKG